LAMNLNTHISSSYNAEIDELGSAIAHYATTAVADVKAKSKNGDKDKPNTNTMSVREVEHQSVSACRIRTATSNLDNDQKYDTIIVTAATEDNEVTGTPMGAWTELTANEAATSSYNHSIVPYTSLGHGETIRIPPMDRHCGGWDTEHFHPHLRLPLESNVSRGMVVTLEAMARECVAVALSPTDAFTMGKTYVVHIGANHDLQTVLRRRLINGHECVDTVVGVPNVCTENKFTKYWIVLQQNGQLSVGMGDTPGMQTLGTLDDSMYHALRSGVDAVKYVGVGNSALGRKARDLRVRNVRVMTVSDCFAATNGIPMSTFDPSKMVSDEKEKDAKLWEDYMKECDKAKARAVKFGIEYKQPPPGAFIKWSEARRMRANPERGFITGMDIKSTEEQEKARKRKERFEEEDRQNKSKRGLEEDNMCDDANMEDDEANEAEAAAKKLVPLEQAWDNEELVSEMRVDPPKSLYIIKDDDVDASKSSTQLDGDGSADRGEGPMQEEENKAISEEKDIELVLTKIHLFAFDWAAFKQIRTDDILSFFRDYGPSYVEWLGELSCNIHFEDKYSAARAMEANSRDLPTEIPLSTNNKDESIEEHNDMEENEEIMNTEKEEPQPISQTNLGSMGWRLLNYPIRKIQSDRYGKRGTRSRCLLRIATSADVLEERPTTWPKPPPGFTTKRVLGPGSDYKKARRGGGKRRRRTSGGEYEGRWENSDYHDDSNDEHEDKNMQDEFGRSAIDRGLKASR